MSFNHPTLKRTQKTLWLATLLALFGTVSCGESFDEPVSDAGSDSEFIQHFQQLTPMCTVSVQGGGTMNVEEQYLPGVVACENGNADFEALKAQAIAARTFLKYKIDIEGVQSIRNSQSDQVSSCGRTPTEEHRRAVRETSGQVITHNGRIIASFYVSGVMPSTASCKPSSSDIARAASLDRQMEQRITYNEGKSGASVRPAQRPMAVPGNPHNRGVMSQNGSSCLSSQGRDAHSILRFYYGDDIRIEQLGGSCVDQSSVDPDQGPSQPEQSSPGNPQAPNTSGATDLLSGGGTTGGGTTGGGSTSGSSCTNGGILSSILPRSLWGATPPEQNRTPHTPNRITFHHTVQPEGMTGPSAVRQIQNWHKQAYGMVDIGYHYIIDRDGTVYAGTPVDRMGAHQKGENAGNVGVAFIGSFGADSAPTSDQLQSAVGLGLQVANQFGFNLGSNSLLGGFLNGQGGSIIGGILNLLFGGGGGSGLCSGSVNGDPSNGITPGGTSSVDGTPGKYNFVRITADATNQNPFPVDAVEVQVNSTDVEILDQVISNSGATSPNGATAKDGSGCADVLTGKIATLAPGGSIVLGSLLLESGLNVPTGNQARFYSSQSGDLSTCMPPVGGSAKIEVSEDGNTWVVAQEGVTGTTNLLLPSLEGNTSGGGSTGGGSTGGGTTVDPNTSTLDPSGQLGGNNGSGGEAPSSTNINQTLAERLATEAAKNDGQRSKGLCWKYVKQSAGRAGLDGFGYSDPMASKGPCSSYNYQLSAYCGGRNWNANPSDLQSTWGFTKLDVHPTEAPRGAIIFWDRGCNGYHATHGHVEIALGDGRACSDYCGTIKSGGGSCSYVFVPSN